MTNIDTFLFKCNDHYGSIRFACKSNGSAQVAITGVTHRDALLLTEVSFAKLFCGGSKKRVRESEVYADGEQWSLRDGH